MTDLVLSAYNTECFIVPKWFPTIRNCPVFKIRTLVKRTTTICAKFQTVAAHK